MAENEKKKNKFVPILITILALIIVAAGVVILLLLKKQGEGGNSLNYTSENGIGFEGTAVVLTSGEAAVEQPAGVGITMSTTATSTDGINFNCKIGNPLTNAYDMYVAIYADLEEEPIYLSGLFHPGEGLTSFKTNTKVPSGTYEVVLCLTLVEEDHKTLARQSNVSLHLIVS